MRPLISEALFAMKHLMCNFLNIYYLAANAIRNNLLLVQQGGSFCMANS